MSTFDEKRPLTEMPTTTQGTRVVFSGLTFVVAS